MGEASRSEEQLKSRVSLVQLVRFLMVKLTHSVSNHIFDIGVIFMTNYSFSRRRCPRRQRGALDDRFCKSQDQVNSFFQMCS
jgi:hypothetical protein